MLYFILDVFDFYGTSWASCVWLLSTFYLQHYYYSCFVLSALCFELINAQNRFLKSSDLHGLTNIFNPGPIMPLHLVPPAVVQFTLAFSRADAVINMRRNYASIFSYCTAHSCDKPQIMASCVKTRQWKHPLMGKLN
jgi:hypothetical protein